MHSLQTNPKPCCAVDKHAIAKNKGLVLLGSGLVGILLRSSLIKRLLWKEIAVAVPMDTLDRVLQGLPLPTQQEQVAQILTGHKNRLQVMTITRGQAMIIRIPNPLQA